MNLIAMALADLSGAETFPVDALVTLRQKWSEARRPLLDCLAAYASGQDRSPENAEKVFFGLHLLAERRETEALAPLLAAATEGEPLYEMIGDATTETLPAIFISLYDGDVEKLKQLVEAPSADEWARVAALETLCWLAACGEWPMEATRDYLSGLFETLHRAPAIPSGMAGRAASRCSGFPISSPLSRAPSARVLSTTTFWHSRISRAI